MPTTGAIAPTPASAGSFVSGIGASAQTPCAAGSFSSAAGATSCTLAALGFFTPTTGATAQTACAPGTTTLAVGATVCVPITFTVTPSVNAVGVITPSTPQLVVVGSTTSFTVFPLTANANFIASVATGPGNCGGTLDGATFTTLPITANCAVAVTFSAPQGQTINFVPLANVTLPSPPVVLSAVASSGLVVSFASNTLAVCTVTGNSVTLLTTGLCSITASQAGSRTFLPAAEFTRSFTAFVRAALQPPEVSTRAGEILSFNFTPGDANATGTARFSFADGSPVPGCESVPLVGGMASCVVPSRFSFISPLTITASYAGDASNPPLTSSFVQVSQADQAVVTTSTEPASPVQAGSPVTITALVRMRNVAGTVSFTPNLSITGTPAPSANCTNLPLTLMPNSTDAAIATCQMIPPTAGTAQVVAVYRYPAGHVSNRIFEQTVQTISVVNNAPIDYTDLWWGGARENGWGVSITQHGNTQVSVIYNYDSAGKPIWYFQSGCVLVGNTCTGAIFQPAGTPLTAYDTAKFSIGAPIGSATFTFRNANTATLSYTINGVSGTKEIERLTFAPPSTLPRLPVADLWWRGLVENGWGLSITQQGRQLFPVIYTYDSAGKTTFYVVPGGTWSGLTFTGDLYSTTSSPWLGVPYDASKFQATKVGTLVIDYRDAGTATITYTINGVSQTRVISRQGF